MSDRGVAWQGSARRGTFELQLSTTLAPGEVVVLLGPNGSGKTTMLRTLAGLEPLASGTLALGPTTWDAPASGTFVPPERRRVGYVFQDHRLFPHLDVVDNVAFGLRMHGTPAREARATASAWLDRLGLAHLARRRPAALSGGQAQRVALARALASEPDLLLLDEPMAALDAEVRAGARTDLHRHLADFAGPAVLVTHDPVEALVLADRVLVLDDGRLVQDGPPAEVARRPRTPWAARFMGLNLLRGVAAGGGRIELDAGGALAATASIERGTPVLATIAPSAVVLSGGRPTASSPRNAWQATVVSVEPLTDRVRVRLDGSPGLLADVTPASLAELRIEPGSTVWCQVKATEVDAWPASER